MKFMNRFIVTVVLILTSSTQYFAQQGTVLDEVIAVVGNQIATKSELENKYASFLAQNASQVTDLTKCQILEDILFSKILVNQAELDSVVVEDSQVEGEIDRRLRYSIAQVGSQEAFESYYKKSIAQFREEFRDPIREQLTLQRMQGEITSGISVTPEEVRNYFGEIPKDSLPLINSEVELAQIVIYAKTSETAIKDVKDKLKEYKKRVIEGEKFSTLALLYSEDNASALKGGEIGFVGKGEVEPEFGNASFKLKPGNVSPIIETRYGFHIIQLIERRGSKVNVRHILLKPKQDQAAFAKSEAKLDSISKLIDNKEISFEEAAKKYSEDETTQKNGGTIANPQTNSSMTPMDQLDPALFFVIDQMKVGDVSKPVVISDPRSKPGYKILKVQRQSEPHRASLEKDYQKIKTAALSQKEQSTLQDWIGEAIEKTYIRLNEDYCKGCTFMQPWLDYSEK